jgi:hypothetical protein
MKKLYIFLFCLISIEIYAQDSLSILFIGNSYTYVNDLPAVLNNLTNSLGDIATIDSRTQGGASFATHIGNSSTYSSIHSKPWDFVVIQGQSQELSFPTSQVNTQSYPYIVQLDDSIHKNKYCSQTILFMTWGRQNGDPQWDSIATYNGMQERLTNAAIRMADSINASISPVGVAWKYARDNYPSINLYSSDGSHPSFEGTYLAACTFYASIYRKSPVNASYLGSLNPTTANILQNIAALTVLDSLEKWNLHPIDEQTIASFSYIQNSTQVSFENTSTQGTTFQWSFGDNTFSTEENPVHEFNENGIYLVELIIIDSCGTDTISHEISINFSGLENFIDNSFNLKKQSENEYYLQSNLDNEFQLSIYTLSGEKLFSKPNLHSYELMDFKNYNDGLYILKIENKTTSRSYKIFKN